MQIDISQGCIGKNDVFLLLLLLFLLLLLLLLLWNRVWHISPHYSECPMLIFQVKTRQPVHTKQLLVFFIVFIHLRNGGHGGPSLFEDKYWKEQRHSSKNEK